MVDFDKLSVVTAVISSILFVILLFYPEVVFWLFSVAESESGEFIARRAAMLFLGIAVLSWFVRSAADSEARQAICLGIGVSMLSLAVVGLFELTRGFAGIGILLAIAVELVLGLSYFRIWFRRWYSRHNTY